jgi:hypothetical protein
VERAGRGRRDGFILSQVENHEPEHAEPQHEDKAAKPQYEEDVEEHEDAHDVEEYEFLDTGYHEDR